MNRLRYVLRRSPYHALAIGFLVAVGCSTVTFAEDNGWILWFHKIVLADSDKTGKTVPMSEKPVWEPGEGFGLFASCRKKATDTLAAYASAYANTMKAEKSNLLLLGGLPVSDNTMTLDLPLDIGGKQFVAVSVVCFPGGFDPRPK